MKQSTT